MFSKNKKTNIKNMVSVGGICLAHKAFTKYLGIQIDSLLNWKPHIETLTSSISKSVGILYKLKDYTSKSILKMVYQALIKSKLQYGIVLWGNSNKSTLDRLNKLHNRALRCITGLPFRTSIVKLYKNAAVLQINELYKFEMLKYMHKQRWSRGHKARGQGQGHKKNPRPRPRTAFPRTDTLEAKDRNARGQGQGPRTQSASALQKKKKKKVFTKIFQAISKKKKKKKKKKKVFTKIFQAISTKKRFPKNFSTAPQNFNFPKNSAVLEPRTGQFSRT